MKFKWITRLGLLIALPLVGFTLCGRAATLPSGFVETEIGGTWNEAVGLTFAADGRMYVWERAGRVWIVENGVKSATPFLDIREEVAGYRDFGLLGFTLHPNFYSNGFVYLMYVVDRHHLMHFGTGNYSSTSNLYYQATIGRITRYTARTNDDFRSVDPASRRVLVGQSRTNGFPILHESHGIGTILFGSDGTLLASCGDAASYASQDTGSASETYWQQGLNDGIIRTKENVGAYRSQLVDCLNGKIIRIDPETGDGIPSNPFYDAVNPRAARSRVWALGLRNPFRMTLRPGTGSHNRADANPGVLYIGDVGYTIWEDLHVCDRPGLNFGWPAFEGLTAHSGYGGANINNLDAPNPLFGVSGCNRQYFYFRELIKQDSLLAPSWPNPCNANQQIPASIPRFVHSRPALDWRHGQTLARTGVYSNNQAAAINVGAADSPVSGTMFPGNSSTGGAWHTNSAFPPPFRNTYFHGDYGAQWIKSFVFNATNKPTAVQNLTTNAGGVVDIEVDPTNGDLYYIAWTSFLRRVRYAPSGNQPPTAVASANTNFGPAPLPVQFSSAGSSDPEGQTLTHRWNFGDGSPVNTNRNPSYTFNAPAGVPTPYTVALTVMDSGGLSATNRLLISVNNTPPQVTITSPAVGARYSISNTTTFSCTATVIDAEHGLGQRTCAWQTTLHHNEHSHSEPIDTNCTTTTLISPVGCGAETYYYRVVLTVTDAAGLSTTQEVRLDPDCHPSNGPPSVSITSPSSGTVVPPGTNVVLTASASGNGTHVTSVQFRANGVSLGTDSSSPYSLTWSNVTAGFHQLTARATDARGLMATSAVVTVVVSNRPPDPRFTNTLISAGSTWKYLDNGSDQGTNWIAIALNDAGWSNGMAQLGYGDGDEATLVRSNRSNGSRIMTTYFRRGFDVPLGANHTNLTLQVLRDDGARVYLNATEIFRNNLPTGTVIFSTPATGTVTGAGESTLFLSTNVNPALLRTGTNVVAAEIHQVNNTSGDISFDLELVGSGMWADVPIFLRAESMGGGQFRIWFEVPPHRIYVIESSSTLDIWSPVSTNGPIGGRVEYIQVNAAPGQRFFRARPVL